MHQRDELAPAAGQAQAKPGQNPFGKKD